MVKKMIKPPPFAITNTKPSWKWLRLPTKHSPVNNLCDTYMFFAMLDHSWSWSQSTCSTAAPKPEDFETRRELVEIDAKVAFRSKRLIQFKDCVAVSIESEDPYKDFRKSMEEMIEAYEVKYWEHLEELLAMYLTMNNKKNHGFIVGAFIDIFVAGTGSTSSTHYAASSSSENRRSLQHRGI